MEGPISLNVSVKIKSKYLMCHFNVSDKRDPESITKYFFFYLNVSLNLGTEENEHTTKTTYYSTLLAIVLVLLKSLSYTS